MKINRFLFLVLTSFALSNFAIPVLVANPPEVIRKILPDPEKHRSGFGAGVALSEDLLAVGAIAGGNHDSGQVSLFDPQTGVPLELLSAGEETENYFGFVLAVENNLLIVGAPLEDGEGEDRGAVYFFDRKNQESWRVEAPDAADDLYFGVSVAIDNGIVVIGAFNHDGDGSDRGAVYVYDVGLRAFTGTLEAPDAADGDGFGFSVDIDGPFTIIGAWESEADAGLSSQGGAYVFNVLTNEFVRKIENPVENANFGISVSLSGLFAAVGASSEAFSIPGDDTFRRGAVYTFDIATGEQHYRLQPGSLEGDSRFGSRCAIFANKLLVSAPKDSAQGFDSGSAFVFDLETGRQLSRIFPSDGDEMDEFSSSIATQGNRILIGSIFADAEPGVSSGAAFLYRFEGKPDLLLGKSFAGLQGAKIFSNSGNNQSIRVSSRKKIRYLLQSVNDGSVKDRISTRSQRSNRKMNIRYRGAGGQNVTAAVGAGTHLSSTLFPGESEVIHVLAKAKKKSGRKIRHTALSTLTSRHTASSVDVGKADLKIRPR